MDTLKNKNKNLGPCLLKIFEEFFAVHGLFNQKSGNVSSGLLRRRNLRLFALSLDRSKAGDSITGKKGTGRIP